MTNTPTVITLLAIMVGATLLRACEPNLDRNARIMEVAARYLLIYPTTAYNEPGNRAYMFEKEKGGAIAQGVFGEVPQGGLRTKVAVVFGYSDNRAACERIAKQLIKDSATWPGYEPPDDYHCNAI